MITWNAGGTCDVGASARGRKIPVLSACPCWQSDESPWPQWIRRVLQPRQSVCKTGGSVDGCPNVQMKLEFCYFHLLFMVWSNPSVLWHCWLGGRKGIRSVKNIGGWWRWALLSPDGVAPRRMVSVSASVNFPFTIKSRNSLLAPAHPDVPEKGP